MSPVHGSRLNLTQVTTLRELARRGTLAAAAEHLGYTPGAVSQHLSSLEASLGVALVQRSGRHLVLTDAGRVMVDHAEDLLAAEVRAVSATRAARESVAGPLVVGTWGSTAAGLLAPVVARLGEAFPEVVVTSREVDLDAVSVAVRHGEVDVAFGLDYVEAPIPRDPAVGRTPLEPEEFAVAVAPDSLPSAAAGPVVRRTPSCCGALDWILPPENTQYGRALRSGLRRRDVEPRVVHEVTDTAASLQLAAAGLGATLTTPLMLRLNAGRLTTLRMPDPLTRRIVLLARRDLEQRQPVRAFVREAGAVVGGLLASLTW